MSGPSSNKYPAKCEQCGKTVEPYAGVRIACDEVGIQHDVRKSKWMVVCDSCWDQFASDHNYNSSSKKSKENMHYQETLFQESSSDTDERFNSIEKRLDLLEEVVEMIGEIVLKKDD